MREILPGCSYAAGRVVDDMVVIVDLKDFGYVGLLDVNSILQELVLISADFVRLGKFWSIKNLVRDSFQITQDYLPET